MAYQKNQNSTKAPPAYLKDYIPVHERLQEFYDKFSDGSIQTEIISPDPYDPDADYIVIRAMAYRFPDDPRPGIGHAHERREGYINETSDSMLENAETSAWGRALAALGIAVTKGVASAEEIKNAERRAEEGKYAEPQSAEEARKRAEERDKELAIFRELSDLHTQLGVRDNDAAKKALLEKSGVAKTFKNLPPEKLQEYVAFLKGEVAKKEE